MPFRGIDLPCILLFALSALAAHAQAPRLQQTIPLPGVEGRIDHLTADVEGQRAFLSALGNGTAEVVDLRKGQRAGEIKGLKEPQGILYMESNHVLYVANGGDGTVRSYNGQSLAPLNSIAVGDDADNLRFDHQSGSVMVGYGNGAIAFLPLDLNGKAKVEIPLPAHPESFQVSADGSRLFVNLPDDHSVASISLVPLAVKAKWGNLGAQANFPMAIDPENNRIFLACRTPAQLLELDATSGKVLARMPTAGDADDLFFDAARRRLYVIGGEGFVDVVAAPQSGPMTSIGHVPTAPGARTGLLVPGWNKLLVAAPHRGSDQARLLVYALDEK